MTGITREKASQVAASYLGGESLYLGTYYKTYAATDSQGRMWRFTYDGSIQAEKKENGERVPADKPYKTEMVSPICTYEDIPTIQELVRQLRHKGAFSNNSCGIHIHVDATSFNSRTLRNLANIFYSKEDLLFSASAGAGVPAGVTCKPMDERFLQELNRKRPQTMRAFQKIWYGGEGRQQYPLSRLPVPRPQPPQRVLSRHRGVSPFQLHRGARRENQGGYPAVFGPCALRR